MTGDQRFADMAGEVAREFLGEPNKNLSSKTELRFGNKGSVSVDLEKGTFYDHSENDGGGVLWFVEQQTGKKGRDAIEELERRGFDIEDRPQPRDSADPGAGRGGGQDQGPKMRPVAEWDYHDQNGNLLFQVVRLEDGTLTDEGKPAKSYRQRRPDPSARGGWNWKTKGMTMVPYRLPDVLRAIASGETVYIVEGEKAADRLAAEGLTATTNPRGAGKWVSELNAHFAGGKVVVIPDNDPQSKYQDGRLKYHDNGDPVLVGQDHAHNVAAQLEGVAAEVRYIELPGLPLKGDVVDWFDGGKDVEDLYDLMDSAPLYEAKPFRSMFRALTWATMDDPGEEHEWLIKDMVTRREISFIAGPSKSGKSFLVLDAAMAVATGQEWFGRKTRRGGVIYQAGEGAVGIKKRIRAYRQHNQLDVTDDIPFVLLPSRVDLHGSDDHTEKLIQEINHWGKTFEVPLELVVIDTFSTATPGANENDGKDVSAVLQRCARISRETKAAVMLVHHMNADGGKIRGHTSILANAENVMIVKPVEDHHDADNRQIREIRVDKNKDGEAGKASRFVLKQVQVGTDRDGDPITSCVVKQPDGTGTQDPQQERPNVSNSEALLVRAIEIAIKEVGSAPPYDEKLPSGAETVVDWKHVSAAYSTLVFDDVDEDSETQDQRNRRLDARRKALSRAGESLMRKGIIGRKKPWVWLSGRKVKGYRPTGSDVPGGERAAEQRQEEQQQPDMWGPDDFAN